MEKVEELENQFYEEFMKEVETIREEVVNINDEIAKYREELEEVSNFNLQDTRKERYELEKENRELGEKINNNPESPLIKSWNNSINVNNEKIEDIKKREEKLELKEKIEQLEKQKKARVGVIQKKVENLIGATTKKIETAEEQYKETEGQIKELIALGTDKYREELHSRRTKILEQKAILESLYSRLDSLKNEQERINSFLLEPDFEMEESNEKTEEVKEEEKIDTHTLPEDEAGKDKKHDEPNNEEEKKEKTKKKSQTVEFNGMIIHIVVELLDDPKNNDMLLEKSAREQRDIKDYLQLIIDQNAEILAELKKLNVDTKDITTKAEEAMKLVEKGKVSPTKKEEEIVDKPEPKKEEKVDKPEPKKEEKTVDRPEPKKEEKAVDKPEPKEEEKTEEDNEFGNVKYVSLANGTITNIYENKNKEKITELIEDSSFEKILENYKLTSRDVDVRVASGLIKNPQQLQNFLVLCKANASNASNIEEIKEYYKENNIVIPTINYDYKGLRKRENGTRAERLEMYKGAQRMMKTLEGIEDSNGNPVCTMKTGLLDRMYFKYADWRESRKEKKLLKQQGRREQLEKGKPKVEVRLENSREKENEFSERIRVDIPENRERNVGIIAKQTAEIYWPETLVHFYENQSKGLTVKGSINDEYKKFEKEFGRDIARATMKEILDILGARGYIYAKEGTEMQEDGKAYRQEDAVLKPMTRTELNMELRKINEERAHKQDKEGKESVK